MKGWYVRNVKIPNMKIMHSIAEDYVVRKVNEWLEVLFN